MKALRALTFVLVLSVCAYAGDMDNGRTEPPPPAPLTITVMVPDGVAGDMDNGVSATTESTVTEAILSLLQSVLSAF